jgi:hypothetical protein
MSKRIRLVSLALLALGLAGCGKDDSAPSDQTVKQSSRLEDIQRKSGGDWNKISDDDKKFLVQELGPGSESKAKMLLGPPPAAPRGVPKHP